MVAALCVAAALLLAYLHFGLLPGRLTRWAMERAEEVTHKKIRFTKVLYLPFRGISFDDLELLDESGARLFRAKHAAVDVRILPFLRKNRIEVSNLYLDTPVYNHSMRPRRVVAAPEPVKTKISGQIDVPVIPEHSRIDVTLGPDAFLPENVYLEQIEIVNGFFTLRRDSASEPLEIVHSINVKLAFRKPPDLVFNGSLKLGRDSYAWISLNGAWNLDTASYEFFLKTKSREIPDWLAEYQKKNFLILSRGAFTQTTHLQSVGDDKALFRTKADLRGALIRLGKTGFDGHVVLDAKGLFDFDTKKFDRYKGGLRLDNVHVSDLSPKIRSLDGLSGQVEFEPDLLTVPKLTGVYKKLPFEASGEIRSFRTLELNGEVRTGSNINQLMVLLPETERRIFRNIEVKGFCQAVTHLEGSLRKPSELSVRHALRLGNASIAARDGSFRLDAVSGSIGLDAQGVNISGARFTKDNTAYALDAFWPKTAGQWGRVNLSSAGLGLRAEMTQEGSALHIREAAASYRGIKASFKGTLLDWKKPRLDLRGDLHTEVAGLAQEWKKEMPWLKNAGLRGMLKGPFTLNGLWNEPLRWDFKFDGAAETLYARDTLRFDDFQIQLRLKESLLNIPYIHANTYGGTLGSRLFFDWTKPGPFFDGKIYLNNVDLAPAVKDLKLKTLKDLAGKVISQMSMRGALNHRETYRGEGAVSIREGHLWKTSLFKKMGELVIVKVEGLETVTFHEANATFKIRDQKLWTEDLTLFSETVDLSLKGWVGFDQKIDMTMFIQYSNDVLRGALDTGGIVPMVLQEAGALISRYKITGTLMKPDYTKEGIPVGRSIGKKISSLFQV